MSNTIGKMFSVTSFGESHGQLIGVVVDGCPAGLKIDTGDMEFMLRRRRPSGEGDTARREPDRPEILSGTLNGITTGAPVAMVVANEDVDSSPYGRAMRIPRPGHADLAAGLKYGGFADHRGGGRFSGRITAGFVLAGSLAKQLLAGCGIEVLAHTVEIGGIKAASSSLEQIRNAPRQNELSCADGDAVTNMLRLIRQAKQEGDSIGGIIEVIGLGLPAGLGEPVFDTLDGDIAKALFAVPAVKGIEFGAGFDAARLRGSVNNDPYFLTEENLVKTATNNAGGVAGGMSNGMPLMARVAIKPTPSISKIQDSIDLETRRPTKLEVAGRHDTCIVPRAVVVIESMAAVTIADFARRAQIIPGVLK